MDMLIGYSIPILLMVEENAILALGLNIQWGYAGLFNVGIAGFAGSGLKNFYDNCTFFLSFLEDNYGFFRFFSNFVFIRNALVGISCFYNWINLYQIAL